MLASWRLVRSADDSSGTVREADGRLFACLLVSYMPASYPGCCRGERRVHAAFVNILTAGGINLAIDDALGHEEAILTVAAVRTIQVGTIFSHLITIIGAKCTLINILTSDIVNMLVAVITLTLALSDTWGIILKLLADKALGAQASAHACW